MFVLLAVLAFATAVVRERRQFGGQPYGGVGGGTRNWLLDLLYLYLNYIFLNIGRPIVGRPVAGRPVGANLGYGVYGGNVGYGSNSSESGESRETGLFGGLRG